MVEVFQDLESLSRAAAERIAVAAERASAKRGRFLVALSGGGTPIPLFKLLAEPPYQTELPWRAFHIFWGDERLVPPNDPQSSYHLAFETLLSRVPVPEANIHRIRGELPARSAVAQYRSALAHFGSRKRPWPRFDLVLLGLGSDGHTASLFPGPIDGEQEKAAVVSVSAAYEDRPAERVSLTPQVFNDARRILFLVSGQSKHAALKAVQRGPYEPEKWPAQRIQPLDGELIWFVDQAAAGTDFA